VLLYTQQILRLRSNHKRWCCGIGLFCSLIGLLSYLQQEQLLLPPLNRHTTN